MSSHLAAAHVELPVMLSELGSSSKRKSTSRSRKSTESNRTASSPNSPAVDETLIRNQSVVSREAGERDPLALRQRVISEEAIDGLKHRKKARRKGKKVAEFYESQNEHIDTLLKPLSTLSAEGIQNEADNAYRVKLAVNISFGLNCCLAVLQLYAAISSGSLALFATMVDSVFDPLANLVLWVSHRKADKVEERKWPLGGSRFETIGNILFSSLMWAVNLVLVVQSIQEFITHKGDDVNELNITSICAVAAAFTVKLGLFLFCFAIRKWSSQVQVLWEDHRNDLFTNALGILTSAGGAKLAWWLDPAGAMVIALAIMVVWGKTIFGEFQQLAGKAAPAEYQNLVTYKAMTFSEEINKIDTVKIYHSGPQYFVEVDIVLPPEMPLWKAHDLAQDLQDQIEALPDVDRCFVHVDHEVDHKPEHRKKV